MWSHERVAISHEGKMSADDSTGNGESASKGVVIYTDGACSGNGDARIWWRAGVSKTVRENFRGVSSHG